MRPRVLDRFLHERGRNEAAHRVDDVPNRERVPDDEGARLRPCEQEPKAGRVASCSLRPALAPTRRGQPWRLGARPFAVCGQEAAVEAPEVDLVQLRDDDTRHVAPVERELERLLRSPELRRDAELDLLARQKLPEPSRLLDAERRQPLAGRSVRREPRVVRGGKRVPGEEDQLHASR